MAIDSNVINQIALIIDDIDATAANYASLFGVPVPEIWSIPANNDIPTYFNGEPNDGSGCRICVFQLGNTVLELVQPDMTRPNAWKDWYDRNGGPGVQHLGFIVKDRQGALDTLAGMGSEAYHVGFYPDMSYTFVNGAAQFGVDFNIKHFGEDNNDRIAAARAGANPPLTDR